MPYRERDAERTTYRTTEYSGAMQHLVDGTITLSTILHYTTLQQSTAQHSTGHITGKRSLVEHLFASPFAWTGAVPILGAPVTPDWHSVRFASILCSFSRFFLSFASIIIIIIPCRLIGWSWHHPPSPLTVSLVGLGTTHHHLSALCFESSPSHQSLIGMVSCICGL